MGLEEMVKRMLITAGEHGAKPNHKQLDAYERYAKQWDAEIIVVPIEGQYKDEPLADRLQQYTIANEMKLNNHLYIRDFGVKAQNINPLTGLRRFSNSMIVGSPKQHLEYVANSPKNSPAAVMSTGACTLPNYKDSTRIGRIGREDHKQGCVLVEVEDDDTFHFRQAQTISDGSFTDLGIRYYPNKKSQHVGIDSIVLGDLHDAQKDETDYGHTLELLKEMEPKNIILHDVFDAYSVTHHDNGRHVLKASKDKLSALDLYTELEKLGHTMEEISSHGQQVYVVKSNHDEHLSRYLDECRFVGDSRNMQLSVQLANAMIDGKDPVEEGIKLTYGSVPKNVKFLQRDDELKRYGYELGFHGDKGPSGSRGSPMSFEYSLDKAIIGHAHSPAIRKNVYRVGTLLRKDVDYAKGSPNNWTTTHALINKDGRVELVNCINGKYTI